MSKWICFKCNHTPALAFLAPDAQVITCELCGDDVKQKCGDDVKQNKKKKCGDDVKQNKKKKCVKKSASEGSQKTKTSSSKNSKCKSLK
jgi:hypothetical protein